MQQRSRVTQLLLLSTVVSVGSLNPNQLCAQELAPTRMLVCESNTDTCKAPDARLDIVWAFNGTEGTASPGGSHLAIERFDSDTIVVRRVDQVGPTAGLTAVYTGSVQGTHISGTVQQSWPDHPGYPANGTFSAVLQDQPSAQPAATAQSAAASAGPSNALPSELLVCENNGPCNAAWTLHGSEGTATWFDRKTTHAKLTVIRSAPDDRRK
jgi:hypothetical protein